MGYKKFFSMSFDDGLEQDKEIVCILKDYGIQATFNLNAGMFGMKNRIGRIGNLGILVMSDKTSLVSKMMHAGKQYRIPEDEIEQVYCGFEVSSHGYEHELLSRLDETGQDKSIQLGIEKLEQLVGYPILGHAYAGGSVDSKAANILTKHGIIYARDAKTSNSFSFPENPLLYQPTCWMIQKNLFDKADEFLSMEPTDGDLLFMVWGHGYEFDFNTPGSNWDRLKRFCEKMAGKSDITYCSNKDAFIQHNEDIGQ